MCQAYRIGDFGLRIADLGGCLRIMSVTKKSENETKFSQI